MKIAALSDVVFENVKPLAERLAELSPDLIIFAGDGLNTFYSLFFSSEFKEFPPEKCLFIAGNNDYPEAIDNLKELGAVNIHDDPFKTEGVVFIGQEGMIVKNFENKKRLNTRFGHTEKEVKDHLSKINTVDQPIVLVSHTPPYEVFDLALGYGNCGSKSVKQLARNPNVKLCILGHVHLSGGNALKSEDTLYINVASHDRGQPDEARIALIDFSGANAQIEWFGIPEEKKDQLYTIQTLASVESESKCLRALEESYKWESQKDFWGKEGLLYSERSLNLAVDNRDPASLVSMLYHDKVTRSAYSALNKYQGDQGIVEFILDEFQPWPPYLGPMSLVNLYENDISPSNPADWNKALEVLSGRLRGYFKSFIRFKIAEKHSKPVIDKDLFSRLRKPSLVFIDTEYAPNTEHFLTVGFKIVNNSSGSHSYLWLDHPNKKSTRAFFKKHFENDAYKHTDIFVFYAGKDDHFVSSNESIDLFKEVKKSVYYPWENKKLQTVARTLAGILGEELPVDVRYMMQDHQKILLSTANYVYGQSTESASFKALRTMCKTDIELLHYAYDGILRLESSSDVIIYEKRKGADRFYDINGHEYNPTEAVVPYGVST